MNQTLKKEGAHRLFGKLYRQARSPALQKQVDQIVKNNKDIFVRIKLIEELDKKNTSKYLPSKKKSEKPEVAKGTTKPVTHKPIAHKPAEANAIWHAEREEASSRPPGLRPMLAKNAPQTKRETGFFERLFRSKSRRITAWGRYTHTLKKKFLHLDLSETARALFSGIDEKDIIQSLKALRLAAGGIWGYVNASNYNTLIAAYQFFSEYTKHKNIFSRTKDVSQWIESTLVMQKSYAHLLQYKEHQKLLLHTLPNYIASTEKYNSLLPSLKISMEHIISLGSQKPSLKDTIIAFYVISENKLYPWDEIERRLGVQKAVHRRFCAPQEVQVLIQQRVQNLRKKHEVLENEIKEIKLIREKHLALREDGHFDTNFLDHLIYDVVRRAYGEKNAVAHVVRSYKSQPHRLLFAILRDFNISYLPLLGSALSVSGSDKVTETINVFSPSIFRERIENFNQLLRGMDTYLRKYPGLAYSFSDFAKNLQKKIFDPSLETFHRIVQQANKFFKDMIIDIQAVLNNHENAQKSKNIEKGKEEQKVKPIEEIGTRARYLPYAEATLLSSGRFNNKTLFYSIENLATHIYNYLYIFHDPSIHELLHDSEGYKLKKLSIEQQLRRLEARDSE